MVSRRWMTAAVGIVFGLVATATNLDANANSKRVAVKKKKILREFQVKPGTLKGIVKDTRGRPMSKATIELKDAKGRSVAKTVTNQRGEYLFKNVPAGKYTAIVNGRAQLALTMTPEANVSRLLIIPPKAAAAGAGAGAAAAGLGTWTWVAIGAGAAVVVGGGVAVAANNSGGSSSRPISP